MNIFRILRLVFEFLSQPRDVDINGPRRDLALILPDFLQQLFPGYNYASLLNKISEKLEFLTGETDGYSRLGDVPVFEIHGNVSETIGTNRGVNALFCAT